MKFDKKVERLSAADLLVEVAMVPWDSELMGFPVAQVERIEITGERSGGQGVAMLQDWLRQNRIGLASCRLAGQRLRESMLLESAGFRFVEMVYQPSLAPVPANVSADPTIAVDIARAEDLAAIEAIAGSAFLTSRFVLDWRLDEAASHRRYRQWIRNAFADQHQQLLRATVDDVLVGFFVVEEQPGGTAYWHLTAVSPTHQRRGMGTRLWKAIVARHHAAGVQRIETTISAHNAPVVNLYARLGFRFDAPRLTLHWMPD